MTGRAVLARRRTPRQLPDYAYQTSPAFFAQYASSPSNMGPYWIGGVKLDFAQFMSQVLEVAAVTMDILRPGREITITGGSPPAG